MRVQGTCPPKEILANRGVPKSLFCTLLNVLRSPTWLSSALGQASEAIIESSPAASRQYIPSSRPSSRPLTSVSVIDSFSFLQSGENLEPSPTSSVLRISGPLYEVRMGVLGSESQCTHQFFSLVNLFLTCLRIPPTKVSNTARCIARGPWSVQRGRKKKIQPRGVTIFGASTLKLSPSRYSTYSSCSSTPYCVH